MFTRIARFSVYRIASFLVVLALVSGCGKSSESEKASGVKPEQPPGAASQQPTSASADTPKSGKEGPIKKSEPPPRKEAAKGPDLTKAKPDFVLDGSEWLGSWNEAEDNGENKIKGKVVEVSGEVRDCGTIVAPDGSDIEKGVVFLSKIGPGLKCATVDREPWAKVSAGSKVKVRGIAKEKYLLDHCVLVEVGPNPAIVLPAKQLAKEHADGTASKKYENIKPYRNLLVDGEIVEIKPDPDTGRARVYLAGDGKVRVGFGLDPKVDGRWQISVLKVGQRIKVLGAYLAILGSATEASLSFARVINE